MLTMNNKFKTIFITVYTLMILTTASAYDASMSEFQWNYPQILTRGTSVVQYSFRLQFGPSACPFDCYYNTQLYLSRDRTWSTDDFALFGPIDTLLIKGSIGFSATVTRPLNPGFSLPASGTYYVFIRLSPGTGAPTDTNNTAMATNPIQVQVITPIPTQMTAATVVTASGTGRSRLVTGYSDGLLEFRDWQGANHNGSTSLQVRLTCVSGNITFYRKVSSEANYDFLRFYIDGVLKGSWSGEVNWSMVSFPVTAGSRAFTWTYMKDITVSQGNDTTWIDDIVFPVSSNTWAILFSVEDEEHPLFEQPVQIDIQYE